jgi:outer membrane protein assembly factor BamB
LRESVKSLALVVAGVCATGCSPSTEAWTFRTPRPIVFAGDSEVTTPVLKDGALFSCGGYFWNDASELFALSAATGQLRWRVRVGWCGGVPPSLVGSTVIAWAEQEGGAKHVAFGVDAASGQTLWTRDLGDRTTFRVPLGEFLYMTTFDGPLRRIHAATGNVSTVDVEHDPEDHLWLADLPGGMLIGAGDAVWVLTAPNVKPVRCARLQSRMPRITDAVSDGARLALGDPAGRLTLFDLGDGRVVWRKTKTVSPPVFGSGRVLVNIFGPNRWELQAVEAGTASVLWRTRGGFKAPTVADGLVYAAAFSAVVVVDEKTGQATAQFPASREVITSPVRAGDLVIFGTIDGVMHAARLHRAPQ